MSEARFDSFAAVIAFAVRREIDAADGYARIAGLAATPGLRELAEDLRRQEESHRRLLEGLDPSALPRPDGPAVPDLGLVDALAEETPAADMTVQDLLILAAQKEARAIALYESLARLAAGAGPDQVFRFLAGQEREHKLRIEAAYEAQVLPEN